MPVVSASYVRTLIEGLTADDDDELDAVIAGADALAARFLLFPNPDGEAAPTLSASTYVDFLDGPDPEDSRRLRLRVRPVVSVEEIRDDPMRVYGTDTDVDAAEYDLDLEAGTLDLLPSSTHAWSGPPPTGWASGPSAVRTRRAIRVTYTAGWDDDAPPPEIVEAVLRIVAALWPRRHVKGLPNATEVEQTDPLEDARPYLAPHRLWERAVGAP